MQGTSVVFSRARISCSHAPITSPSRAINTLNSFTSAGLTTATPS